MSLVAWKEGYSVNIKEIDAQHQKLVSILNELHSAVLAGKGKEVLGTVLDGLIQYTVTHFKTEEYYFDKFNYPETELHKKQHLELVEQVTELKLKFDAGENIFTIDLMNFLKDWLQEHIVGSDKKFGPFLNSKGVF